MSCFFLFFFFFQAEDGIRDWSVTGVQTCALPIYLPNVLFANYSQIRPRLKSASPGVSPGDLSVCGDKLPSAAREPETASPSPRSEERRVGKECRSRWSP